MHRVLPYSWSGLVSSSCAGSSSSLGSFSTGSIANVQICDTNINCNAWGAKYNMIYD
jgi:hypothetical protein